MLAEDPQSIDLYVLNDTILFYHFLICRRAVVLHIQGENDD